MKAVMFSINRPHTDNIKSDAKKSELRTRPPKIKEPYKAYIYEPKKNGGCGKVIGEFTAFNEFTYRMCMGVPKLLVLNGCISVEEIWSYTNKGEKDLTEISICDLLIYDKPKELSEFRTICKYRNNDGSCQYRKVDCDCVKFDFNPDYSVNLAKCCDFMVKPPQSWCYVEEVTV